MKKALVISVGALILGAAMAWATGQGEAAASAAPYVITTTMEYDATVPPDFTTPVWQEINKRMNARFEVIWAAKGSYTDRLNLMLSSGDVPMMVYMSKNPTTMGAMRSGMFWSINPYLDKYKFITGINPLTIKADSVDGVLYTIPRLREMARSGHYIRQDWLEALKLKKPETLDEVYAALKAFTLNDPDGNGKQDTRGLVEDKRLWTVDDMAIMLGAPNFYGVKDDGTFTIIYDHPVYMDVLRHVRRLYAEQLMNQDFAIIPNMDHEFLKGASGMLFGAVDSLYAMQLQIEKVVPTAKLDCIIWLNNPTGRHSRGWNAGSLGGFAISKSKVKTDAEVRKLLSVYDRFMSEDILNLIHWGFEGVQYRMVDGHPERIPDAPMGAPANSHFLECGKGFEKVMQAKPNEITLRFQKYLLENEKNATMDQSLPFYSKTMVEKGSEIKALVQAAKIKFVMGQIDEAGFREEVNRWHSQGGDEILKELAAEYAKAKK